MTASPPLFPPDYRVLFEAIPEVLLVLLPNAPVFTIAVVTEACLLSVGLTRENTVGKGVFEVLTPVYDRQGSDGISLLRDSLERVLATRTFHAMPAPLASGAYPSETQPGYDGSARLNVPVLGSNGEVLYIIHRARAASLDAELLSRDQQIADLKQILIESERSESALAAKAHLAAVGADVGTALSQTYDLSVALHRCVEAIVHHLEAAFARIWTLNDQSNVLELRASAGLYTHLDGPHSRVPVGAFKIGRIAQSRLPHLSNDVPNDPEVSDHAWAKRENMIAFAGYPLLVEGRVVGVMAMFARHVLLKDTLHILGSVADSIAMGIERKRIEQTLTRQAQELARSNADLQHFAYVTSHDLQEPLRTMISFSQLLSKRYHDRLDGDAASFLEYIVAGAHRMRELIESMLSYSRVTNVETMPFVPVDTQAVVRWATMNLQTVVEETHATLTVGSLPQVSGDRVQLVQLFQNLISNAIKYHNPGQSPVIHVSAAKQGVEWLFRVQDEGLGIEPFYHEQIFGVFKRLHGREIPGTGIGLSICRRIVERHGGRIWVESALGEGATFCFTLSALV